MKYTKLFFMLLALTQGTTYTAENQPLDPWLPNPVVESDDFPRAYQDLSRRIFFNDIKTLAGFGFCTAALIGVAAIPLRFVDSPITKATTHFIHSIKGFSILGCTLTAAGAGTLCASHIRSNAVRDLEVMHDNLVKVRHIYAFIREIKTNLEASDAGFEPTTRSAFLREFQVRHLASLVNTNAYINLLERIYNANPQWFNRQKETFNARHSEAVLQVSEAMETRIAIKTTTYASLGTAIIAGLTGLTLIGLSLRK